VVATFETGVYDFDNLFVICAMEDVQTLLMMGDEVGIVEVKVREPDEIDDQIGAPAARSSPAAASRRTGVR
jgi:lipoprotein-releasing system permease protein